MLAIFLTMANFQIFRNSGYFLKSNFKSAIYYILLNFNISFNKYLLLWPLKPYVKFLLHFDVFLFYIQSAVSRKLMSLNQLTNKGEKQRW